MYCRVVILQAGVVVISLGQYGLAKIRLKNKGGFSCLPCLFAQRDRRFKSRCDVAERIIVRQERPTKGKFGIYADCLPEILLCAQRVGVCVFSFQCISQAAQVGIVSLGIVCRFGGNDLLFLAAEVCSQLVSDSFGHFTLDQKNVSEFAIESISPK